jgi:hypothetical protein
MPANGKQDATAAAIRATLISPNESDSNLEAANVVDGLFAIARALDNVARAIPASTSLCWQWKASPMLSRKRATPDPAPRDRLRWLRAARQQLAQMSRAQLPCQQTSPAASPMAWRGIVAAQLGRGLVW